MIIVNTNSRQVRQIGNVRMFREQVHSSDLGVSWQYGYIFADGKEAVIMRQRRKPCWLEVFG